MRPIGGKQAADCFPWRSPNVAPSFLPLHSANLPILKAMKPDPSRRPLIRVLITREVIIGGRRYSPGQVALVTRRIYQQLLEIFAADPHEKVPRVWPADQRRYTWRRGRRFN